MAMCPICEGPMVSHEYLCQGDGSMEDGNPEPRPGDVSLCDGCGNILIFTEGDRLRTPTIEEALGIALSPAGPILARAQRQIVQQRLIRERAN